MEPERSAQGGNKIKIKSPGEIWSHVDDLMLRKRTNDADAWMVVFWSLVKNTLYYRNYTSGAGAPFSLGETYEYDEQNDSGIDLGDFTYHHAAAVDSSLHEITVNGRTFNCYQVTVTVTDGGSTKGTFTEYWDADGIFPYAQIKVIDNYNFDVLDTRELWTSNVLP